MAKFIRNTKIKLNINFPEKTVEGEASNCRVKVVPLSSSETNALDSPDIAEKNITTQSKPPVKCREIVSCPIENKMTLMVTKMNIASAFIA